MPLLFAAVCALMPGWASAQVLPSHPITFLGGRLTVSGDGAVSFSTSDHDTYFNYGGYQHDTLRLTRLGVAATLRMGPRVTAVAEVRAEGETTGGAWRGYPVSLFLRVRPLRASSLAVAAGIVQPVFGAFMQRRYGTGNLLIGYPLAYQYTTAVRADAIPATADEVLQNHARGWEPYYSIGAGYGVAGLPLVNATGWSPGFTVSAQRSNISAAVAVTQGGLAAPGSVGWNGGWEGTGRVELRPVVGLVVGLSGARGSFVDGRLSSTVATAVANRDPRETAFGVDVEYSWGYWLLRMETIVSRRTYPAFRPPYLSDALTAVAIDGEVRYTIRPGLYAAARIGHLSFGTIDGSAGPASWDADVTRIETGLGYSLIRNVLVKAVYQYDRRDSTFRPSVSLGAAQLVVRF
ncbi:MAG TPA: hypothetical protein VF332_03440 [Vicinamibacterales bacterium]